MKSIKERAKEYIQDIYGGPYTDVELGFIRGAQSEHEELTRGINLIYFLTRI